MTLVQKKNMPFVYPKIHKKDILFSEKECRKVGNWEGITWIHSEKGLRYIVKSNEQFKVISKLLETTS